MSTDGLVTKMDDLTVSQPTQQRGVMARTLSSISNEEQHTGTHIDRFSHFPSSLGLTATANNTDYRHLRKMLSQSEKVALRLSWRKLCSKANGPLKLMESALIMFWCVVKKFVQLHWKHSYVESLVYVAFSSRVHFSAE